MTKYEICAIILSIIAILIPFFQWMWKKWVVKPKLNFYPTGRAYLFANKSGSYIRIEGVYEALKKSISIKKISVKVIRQKDDSVINLNWSTFTNPVNQQIMGAVASTSEIAHPFRIDADNVACAFTEFTDFYDSSAKTIQPFLEALYDDLQKINFEGMNYIEAHKRFTSLTTYEKAKEVLRKENFWDIGKYEIIIKVEYGKNEKKFYYGFDVSKEMHDTLAHNIDEILASLIKNTYKLPIDIRLIHAEIEEINK